MAAIVDSSDDAIVSKTLDGVITSWNAAAERTFGYSAAGATGRSITLIIPEDRLDEEKDVLTRVRRGKRGSLRDGTARQGWSSRGHLAHRLAGEERRRRNSGCLQDRETSPSVDGLSGFSP